VFLVFVVEQRQCCTVLYSVPQTLYCTVWGGVQHNNNDKQNNKTINNNNHNNNKSKTRNNKTTQEHSITTTAKMKGSRADILMRNWRRNTNNHTNNNGVACSLSRSLSGSLSRYHRRTNTTTTTTTTNGVQDNNTRIILNKADTDADNTQPQQQQHRQHGRRARNGKSNENKDKDNKAFVLNGGSLLLNNGQPHNEQQQQPQQTRQQARPPALSPLLLFGRRRNNHNNHNNHLTVQHPNQNRRRNHNRRRVGRARSVSQEFPNGVLCQEDLRQSSLIYEQELTAHDTQVSQLDDMLREIDANQAQMLEIMVKQKEETAQLQLRISTNMQRHVELTRHTKRDLGRQWWTKVVANRMEVANAARRARTEPIVLPTSEDDEDDEEEARKEEGFKEEEAGEACNERKLTLTPCSKFTPTCLLSNTANQPLLVTAHTNKDDTQTQTLTLEEARKQLFRQFRQESQHELKNTIMDEDDDEEEEFQEEEYGEEEEAPQKPKWTHTKPCATANIKEDEHTQTREEVVPETCHHGRLPVPKQLFRPESQHENNNNHTCTCTITCTCTDCVMTNSPVCGGDDVKVNVEPFFLKHADPCHTKLPSLDNRTNSKAPQNDTNIYPRWMAPGSEDDNDNDDDNNTTFAVTQETHPEEHQRRSPRCWRPRRRRRSTDADEDHEEHELHPPRTQPQPERNADDNGDPDSAIKSSAVFKITSTSTKEQVVDDQDQDNTEPPCAWKNMHMIPMSHSHSPPQPQQKDDSLRLDLLLRKADLCHTDRAVIPDESEEEDIAQHEHENHDEPQDNSSSDGSPTTGGSDDAIHNESDGDGDTHCADDEHEPATMRLPHAPPHSQLHAQRVPMLWRRRRTSIQ
jgi:hypothetical protein